KYENLSRHPGKTADSIRKLQVLLKLIPDVDGKPKIAQLVGLHITEVTVKGSWSSPARLHLVPHVNAPVADLPVRKVLGGRHFIADLPLRGGNVLHDYMKSGTGRPRRGPRPGRPPSVNCRPWLPISPSARRPCRPSAAGWPPSACRGASSAWS